MSNLRMGVSMIAGKPVDALEPHEATAAAERGELSLLDVPHLSDDAKRAVALLVPGYEMRLRQTPMGVAATWVPRSATV